MSIRIDDGPVFPDLDEERYLTADVHRLRQTKEQREVLPNTKIKRRGRLTNLQRDRSCAKLVNRVATRRAAGLLNACAGLPLNGNYPW